jgi:hypothetical protein
MANARDPSMDECQTTTTHAYEKMRPISLFEVIRKVWTIHRVLHEAEVLHGAQSGYRLDQGTMISLLQAINKIK